MANCPAGHNEQENDDWMFEDFTIFCKHLAIMRNSSQEATESNHPGSELSNCESAAFEMTNLRMLFVLFIMIGYGALVRSILRATKCHLPYTVVLMLSGLLIGVISRPGEFGCDYLYTYTAIARIPPKIILFTFLPTLIFESAFSITPHTFVRSISQILLVALLGMGMATFMTAAIVNNFMLDYKWSFLEASLFGAIISATDPVAVVAILRELGTSEMLSVMIEGESLLNDGIAILLYEILLEIITCKAEDPLWEFVLKKFGQITLGGPLFGFFMGKIAVFCLSLIFNDSTVEITITLVAAYLTYYIGEGILGVSGVMAVVVLGITMGAERTSISPEVENFVHHFWEMVAYLANTVLFIITGIVITETAIIKLEANDLMYLCFLYVVITIVRFVMLVILYPILSRIGYGLTWQNLVVMWWGGLRGAVGLCLALDVFQNPELCDKDKIGPKYLFLTAGCVFLTLVVNGTTTNIILNILKLTAISPGRFQDMINALKQLETAQSRTISMLKYDRFVADANWFIVDKYTVITNPYLNKKHKPENELEQSSSLISIGQDHYGHRMECPECHANILTEPNTQELTEMTEEARLRVLKALKVSFWRQFEQGILVELAVQQLVNVTAAAEDKPLRLIHTQDLRKFWSIRGCLPWVKSKLAKTFGLEEEVLPPKPRNRIRGCCWYLATKDWFEYIMLCVILLNMIPVIWDMARTRDTNKPMEVDSFFICSVVFNCIYILEFAIKVAGRGWYDYFCVHKLNYIDVATIILGIVDMIVSLPPIQASQHIQKHARQAHIYVWVKILRVLRAIKLLKPVAPRFIHIMDSKINAKLFLGYDVGKGFVTAIDDVIKFMPIMVDHPKVLVKLKRTLEHERLETVREMGIMQKDHPGIAIAVKTRHASRAVLNQMRSTLMELQEDGLVDEKECNLLIHKLEENMKRLWKTPPSIAPSPPEFLLANVPWIAGNKELFDYLFSKAELLSFGFGDVISNVGDPPAGIYIITSGMVKIKYVPNPEIIKRMEEDGDIPNVEIILDLTFRSKEEDFFSTGTVLGEKSVLSRSPRCATAKCETSVFAFHLTQKAMEEALEKFNDPYDSLESRIWRSIGMRIAVAVLPKHPSYALWGVDRIRLHVERSFVPIGPQFETIVFENFIAEILVIEGKVRDPFTDDVYTAPALIPRSTSKITLLNSKNVKARVLVIAHEDFFYYMDFDALTELQKCFESILRLSASRDFLQKNRPDKHHGTSGHNLYGVRRSKNLNIIARKTASFKKAILNKERGRRSKRKGSGEHLNIDQGYSNTLSPDS